MTIHIQDIRDPLLAPYASLTEGQLRHRRGPLLVAESPNVILRALQHGYRPVSLLCEERHIQGDAAEVLSLCPDEMPVYTGEREVLAQLTGYTLTRGVLCAMQRPEKPSVEEVCRGARRVAVLHGLCDAVNVGAIFRSAAALGIDAVLLTPDSCDPYGRRASRVSMGAVFMVPWTWIDPDLQPLRDMGFQTLAMALRHDSVAIDDPQLKALERLAVILGPEGPGLPDDVITSADMVARIPMARGVDSLNVAAAAAVAFYELRIKNA